MDKLLFGKDSEERIVAIEQVSGMNLTQVFVRNKNDEVESRFEKSKYFIYVGPDEQVDTEPLFGTNYYNRKYITDSLSEFYETKKKLKDCYVPYIGSQYQVQTGKTLFKGMKINDPLVMYFDIEVYSDDAQEFVNSSRRDNEIIIIAVRTNRGDEHILLSKHSDHEKAIVCEDERDLINNFIAIVRSYDPDIITNHNIFNFDLKYIKDRCGMYGIPFAIGRDGSEPKTFDTKIKFADREREYTNFAVYGRSIIDTQFLAEYADVVLRSMPSYGLKELVKFLGKASDDRVYIEGSEIGKYWRDEHEKLVKYALDDVREAEIVYNQYGQSFFYMTPWIPMSYQEVFRYGTGNQIEYLFMREYYDQNWSFPKRDEERDFGGGYADVLKFGLFIDNLIYADVESLYPSLGVLLNIQPKKDELKIYQRILRLLIDKRFEIKTKIKDYKAQGLDSLASQQKAQDGSVKILLNTMSFGFLGWSYGAFNDYDEAERITTNGQKIVKEMIRLTEEAGGVPIKVDTDGVLLIPPAEYKDSEEKEMEFCKFLTDNLPEGIRIGLDGRYSGAITFDGKSYALKEYDGTITTKGNTIKGRGVENFGKVFVKEIINNLFDNNIEKCRELYERYKDAVLTNKLTIDDIAKSGSLNMSLEEYQNKTESGQCNRSATYELALKATKSYMKGDKVRYYVKKPPIQLVLVRKKPVLRKANLPSFEKAELAENYNNDYDIDHYMDRFNKIVKKFIILGKETFETMFDVPITNADKQRYIKITNKDYN